MLTLYLLSTFAYIYHLLFILHSKGETDKILNKWDNHNSIARGWGGVKENYHPVTFRGIYNVDAQKNFSTQNL